MTFFTPQQQTPKEESSLFFYFRVLRICSSRYLNDEFNHIENFFLNPKFFTHLAKSEVLKILNKNPPETNASPQSYKTNPLFHTFMTLPNNSSTNSIINTLNKLDIKTASLPSKRICDLVHSSRGLRDGHTLALNAT